MSEADAGPADFGPFDSRTAYREALAWGLRQAFGARARRILAVDADFADWPLDDAVLLDELGAWLRLPQRQLLLLAASFDDVPRCQPRFTQWRRPYAHAVLALRVPEDERRELPALLLSDRGTLVRLIDTARWRGRASVDERAASLLLEQIDAISQRSEPAFPAHTLGLF